jgi:methionyl-tRNA formyltransferase
MIIFFGSSLYSIPVLEKLVRAKKDVFVITTKDKPAGRGKSLSANPLKKYACKKNLEIFCPEKLDSFSLKKLKVKLKTDFPDLAVCCVYGKIIPQLWLKSFPKGILNVHPSLLPKYRGPSPVQFAVLKGEKTMGASIMVMDSKIDHGPIVFQKKHPSSDKKTADELFDNLFSLAADNITHIVDKQLAGKTKPKKQNHCLATFTNQISKNDGFVDLEVVKLAVKGKSIEASKLSDIFQLIYPKKESFPPEIVDRARRAFSPWPGIYTKIKLTKKGKTEEKILKIIDTKMNKKKLEIKTVQLEGKNPVTFWQFCSAYQIF